MSELTEMLRLQAGVCAAMGSPFSAALLERCADALPNEPSVRAAFAPWAEAGRRKLFDDAVALRWLGALHEAALREPASPLARAYPRDGAPGDAEAAWAHALELMRLRGEDVAAFMRHEPQTNEPRRSAVLLPGFLVVAAKTGLPLRALELGASAGLNQLWDRRRYRLGALAEWGPKDAPVLIDIDWRGGLPPLEAPVRVADRAACDRSPVDIADPAQRRRLRAYVWPDQTDRLERLDAAIAQTLAAGLTVEREDAVAWTGRHAAPRAGVATVVFHSVFFQYMPKASQAALVETLEALGGRANPAAPLAWLRMEPAPAHPATMELRLTLWPGGEDRLLATAHPHGAWIEWAG
ncbi:MAG: DUF2332 domain-containing protein [Caulobacteraceae bacterium]